MKVSREQAAANRERILDTASRLFRERGFDGIGVAELMEQSGLTHGGFYGHFASKDDLMARACERSLADSVARWSRLRDRGGEQALSAIVDGYLSKRHRDDPGGGCAVPALGSDMPRHGLAVRRAVTEGVRSLVDVLASVMPGKSRAAKRRAALAGFASMVGAVVLARAVDDAKLSDEVLDAVAAAIESGS